MAKFGSFVKGYLDQKNKRTEQSQSANDALYKEAMIREAGYDINKSRFGKPELVGGAGLGSTKALERRKILGDIDKQDYEKKMRDQVSGGGDEEDTAIMKKIAELEAEANASIPSGSTATGQTNQSAPVMAEPSDEFKLKANAILKKYGMGGI